MKFAAAFVNDTIGRDFAEIRDVVQAIEGVGFDGISTNDHVVGGHPDRLREGEKMHTHLTAVHEPLVLLSFIGAVTERLELATAVLLLPQRQTTLVAKQVAELDLLSNGRVRLGVGIGRNWMEYEALDEDFTNRGRRIEEQVEVLRAYWTDELVTYAGTWHSLDRIGLNPMPIQRPIPIWMGSFVGKIVERVLERIGRMADGWMPQYPADQLAPALERVRGYAAAAGRDPDDLGVECVLRIAADDDPASWVADARAFAEVGATHLKVFAGAGAATPAERASLLERWHRTVVPELPA